jgi:hypothetical protein
MLSAAIFEFLIGLLFVGPASAGWVPAAAPEFLREASGLDSLILGAPASYDTGNNPTWPVIADFDRDGKPDLAVCNFYGNTVSVLRGQGDGTYLPKTDWATGSSPHWMAAADLNRDGWPDLVTTNRSGAGISVLFNVAGTFPAHIDYDVQFTPWVGAIGDLNRDGNQDLVVPGGIGITVFLGSANGSLTRLADYPQAGPSTVMVADFNLDGIPDVAVGNIDRTISVRLGVGDGTLGSAVGFTSGANVSMSLADRAADFNLDGKPDLVWSVRSDSLGVALGNGDGTFAPRQMHKVGDMVGTVVTGDINRDGKPDLVTIGWTSSIVSILLGRGDGTFWPRQDYPTVTRPNIMTLGDVNLDGLLDIVVTVDQNYYSPVVSVLLTRITPPHPAGVPDVITLAGGVRIQMAPPRPDPMSVGSLLRFRLASADRVSLRVHDVIGRTVRTLVDSGLEPGEHSAYWNGRTEDGAQAAAGVYYVRLRSGSEQAVRKLVVIR